MSVLGLSSINDMVRSDARSMILTGWPMSSTKTELFRFMPCLEDELGRPGMAIKYRVIS